MPWCKAHARSAHLGGQEGEEYAFNAFCSPSAYWSRLERLELGMCGRGFLDNVAEALAGAKGGLQGLEALLLGGAYSLLDHGLESLLKAAPHLQELRLPQCCRLTGTGLACLPHCTPLLRSACSQHSTSSLKCYKFLGTCVRPKAFREHEVLQHRARRSASAFREKFLPDAWPKKFAIWYPPMASQVM